VSFDARSHIHIHASSHNEINDKIGIVTIKRR